MQAQLLREYGAYITTFGTGSNKTSGNEKPSTVQRMSDL
jgi:hypothetical protein